jgi:hypothetical protein
LDVILGDAHYHISKDWSLEPGIQGGDGIMYHRLIAPNGDIYQTRNQDAILWACGSEWGNWSSEHVQVMLGEGQMPTVEQLAAMRTLELEDSRGMTFPHNYWSGTQCPGPQLTAWVYDEGWKKEDDMTRAEFNEWFKEQYMAIIDPTIVAMKNAYDPLIGMARANNLLDAAQEAAIAEAQARLDRLKTI